MVSKESDNRIMDKANLAAEVIAPLDTTKKKKKKRVAIFENVSIDSYDKEEVVQVRSDEQPPQPLQPCKGTDYDNDNDNDSDYQYADLLKRIYGDRDADGPKKVLGMKLPVPQVLRMGTKRTVHVNFLDFCKIMHREPKHLADFAEMELGTSVSLDEQQRLVVNGRFAPKHFEALLRKYAVDYVICNGCKSSDTSLSKENRISFIRCEQCGSARSIQPVTQRIFNARVSRTKVGA